MGCVRFEWEAELSKDDKVVTLPYRSIELLLGMRKLCPCLDMWALGCTVAELSVGQRVFQSTVMTSEVEPRFFGLTGRRCRKAWSMILKIDYSVTDGLVNSHFELPIFQPTRF